MDRTRAADQVSEDLRYQILSGHLARGTRLPSEKELAARYDVSPPTIREALRALSAMSLIEVRHGSGAYVIAETARLLSRAMIAVVQLERVDLLSILEVSEALYAKSVRLAVAYASDADIAALRSAAEQFRPGQDDGHLASALGDFLRTLVDISHNALLISLMGFLIDTQLSLAEETSRTSRSAWQRIAGQLTEERMAVVEALEARDAGAAEAAALRYTRRGYGLVRAVLENELSPRPQGGGRCAATTGTPGRGCRRSSAGGVAGPVLPAALPRQGGRGRVEPRPLLVTTGAPVAPTCPGGATGRGRACRPQPNRGAVSLDTGVGIPESPGHLKTERSVCNPVPSSPHRWEFQMSRAHAAATLAAASLVLSACGGSSAAGSGKAPAPAADATTATTAVTVGAGSGAAYAPLTADAAAQGLKITLQPVQSGAAAIPLLLQGQLQFTAADTVGALKAIDQGVPIVIVALVAAGGTSPANDNTGILAKRGAAIRTAADLNGKNVGVGGIGSSAQLSAAAAIDKAGGDSASVKFVEVPPQTLASAVQAGTVDAAVTSEPGVSAGRAAGLAVIATPISEVLPSAPLFVYVTSKRYLAEKPDVVATFARNMAEANAAAAKDPDLVRNYAAKSVQLNPAQLQQMVLPQFTPAKVEKSGLKQVADLMVKYKVLTKSPNLDSALYQP